MTRILIAAEADNLIAPAMPVADKLLTQSEEQAGRFAEKNGYPVVLKLISPKIIHKTDIGAVRVARDETGLDIHYRQLMALGRSKKVQVQGILIQEFVKGKELILGIKKDPTFGPTIMLGLGGIYAEVFKDVTFRVCPITEHDADSMIHELKSKDLLFGVRGERPGNIQLLKIAMMNLSRLALKYNIEELDINPFILNDRTGKAVDVRIVLADGAMKEHSVKMEQLSPAFSPSRPRKKRPQRKNELHLVSKFLGIEL